MKFLKVLGQVGNNAHYSARTINLAHIESLEETDSGYVIIWMISGLSMKLNAYSSEELMEEIKQHSV